MKTYEISGYLQRRWAVPQADDYLLRQSRKDEDHKDRRYLTGDTIWFGADGGCSFIATLAEDNKLAVRSLEKLEKELRRRNKPLKIITGHTGWTDDLDFAFLRRDKLCKPFTEKYTDPAAPYDGYVEDDDIEENARHVLLRKVKTE